MTKPNIDISKQYSNAIIPLSDDVKTLQEFIKDMYLDRPGICLKHLERDLERHKKELNMPMAMYTKRVIEIFNIVYNTEHLTKKDKK